MGSALKRVSETAQALQPHSSDWPQHSKCPQRSTQPLSSFKPATRVPRARKRASEGAQNRHLTPQADLNLRRVCTVPSNRPHAYPMRVRVARRQAGEGAQTFQPDTLDRLHPLACPYRSLKATTRAPVNRAREIKLSVASLKPTVHFRPTICDGRRCECVHHFIHLQLDFTRAARPRSRDLALVRPLPSHFTRSRSLLPLPPLAPASHSLLPLPPPTPSSVDTIAPQRVPARAFRPAAIIPPALTGLHHTSLEPPHQTRRNPASPQYHSPHRKTPHP